ncbi:MAG: lipopolysaccharide biosynthesis protein [Candidatus Methylomirabilales bacterium]
MDPPAVGAAPPAGGRIARASLGGITTNAAIQALSFGTGILVTRALGPEGRGIFFLVMAFVTVVVTVGTFGLSNANTVFVAQRRHPLGTLHANSVAAALGMGVGGLLLYGVLREPINASILAGVPVAYVFWGLGQTPLLFYENFWAGMAIGAGEVGRYYHLLLGKTAATALLVCGLFALGALDLVSLLAVWTAINVGGVVWMYRALRRLADGPMRPSWAVLQEALQFGVRVHLGGIATMVWQRFDSFFLNATHGAVAVGQYSLAVSLTEGLWRVVGPVANAIQQPVVADGGAGARAITQKALRHVLFVLLVLGGSLGITAPWVVPALYGEAFAPAVPAVQLLVVGTVGVGLAMVTSVYFVGVLDRGGLLSALAWLNAAVNIALCLLLVPGGGVVGAAQASAITYVFGVVVVLVLFRRMTASRWADLLLLRRQDLADYGTLLRALRGGLRG